MVSVDATQFVHALVSEFAAAIEAIGGTPTSVSTGTGVTGDGWCVSLDVKGTIDGSASLTLGADGVRGLLQSVLGQDADTSDGAVRDLLRELLGQAIGSLGHREQFVGVTITIGSLQPGPADPGQTSQFLLVSGDREVPIAATGSLRMASAPLAAPAQSKSGASSRPETAAAPMPMGNLDVVLDIDLPLSIRFGSTTMSIRALSALGPGSIVDMGRSPDDPVEVLICGRVIARAEVVIVGGNYGIRITDLTSAADRIRALEGQW